MEENLPELRELIVLAEAAPPTVRWAVGAVGAVLLLFGAKLYRPGLLLGAFAAGAIGGAGAMELLAPLAPELDLTDPRALAAAAFSTGLVGAGVASVAHRLALVVVGGLAGLLASAALVGALALPWWTLLLGVGLGAVLLPWVYPHLLKVLTPAVGALVVAWAAHMLDAVWLLALLWALGVAWQIRAARPEAE